ALLPLGDNLVHVIGGEVGRLPCAERLADRLHMEPLVRGALQFSPVYVGLVGVQQIAHGDLPLRRGQMLARTMPLGCEGVERLLVDRLRLLQVLLARGLAMLLAIVRVHAEPVGVVVVLDKATVAPLADLDPFDDLRHYLAPPFLFRNATSAAATTS